MSGLQLARDVYSNGRAAARRRGAVLSVPAQREPGARLVARPARIAVSQPAVGFTPVARLIGSAGDPDVDSAIDALLRSARR